MSRRLILFIAVLALSVALAIAEQSSTPLLVDVIVRAVELIIKAPIALLFVVLLLILTAGAGAWATVVGMRTHGRRIRLGRRHRYHW